MSEAMIHVVMGPLLLRRFPHRQLSNRRSAPWGATAASPERLPVLGPGARKGTQVAWTGHPISPTGREASARAASTLDQLSAALRYCTLHRRCRFEARFEIMSSAASYTFYGYGRGEDLVSNADISYPAGAATPAALPCCGQVVEQLS